MQFFMFKTVKMFLNIFLLEKHHEEYILIKRKLITEVRKNINYYRKIMKEFQILKYFFKVTILCNIFNNKIE